LPFAEGKSITLGVDDALARVNVKSDTADLMLFDGRDRAPNGWFVLRSLIPSNKTTDAIVWHIRPDVIPNWTRPTMIAHSQVGYAPGFSKVAVLELDPKYNAPKRARVLHLMEDGSYKQVFEAPITPSTPWLRYVYSKFDFTPVKDPGLYVIEYANQRTTPFPVSKDAYANIWQDSLDHHLAAQMDHVSVREGYRMWHGASHLDDGRMAPVVGEQFDGRLRPRGARATERDSEPRSGVSRIQSLKYDELTVDEAAREVEMHRPDGVPDTVQQVQHGALLILAQFHNIGHPSAALTSQICSSTHRWATELRRLRAAFTTRSSARTKRKATTPASRTIAGSSLRTTRISSGMPLRRWLQRQIRRKAGTTH
jgi:hypothetical protein